MIRDKAIEKHGENLVAAIDALTPHIDNGCESRRGVGYRAYLPIGNGHVLVRTDYIARDVFDACPDDLPDSVWDNPSYHEE